MNESFTMNEAVNIQRKYYSDTAKDYDDLHMNGFDQHDMALTWLSSLIRGQNFMSVLDVGSGTGRCIQLLKKEGLSIKVTGIEPVDKLREIGLQKGLTEAELLRGDALALPFNDNSYDVVCSFGVLHHIQNHHQAVAEMCRVARQGVFISDSNNYGQGRPLSRFTKQMINAFGLWKLFDFVSTRGKCYHYSEEDGVFYSYSILNDLQVIKNKFPNLFFLGTNPSGPNLYRTSSHIAIFARKA